MDRARDCLQKGARRWCGGHKDSKNYYVARYNPLEAHYDGKKILDVKDTTFPQAGKIGLWTKADAQTHFADLRVSGGN
jgi:hypothetical protein